MSTLYTAVILLLGATDASPGDLSLEPLQRFSCAVSRGDIQTEDVPVMRDPELALRVVDRKPTALRKLDLELRALLPEFEWPEGGAPVERDLHSVEDWASNYLAALGQGDLVGDTTPFMRFGWAPTFHPGLVITVVARDHQYAVEIRQGSGPAGFLPGKLCRIERLVASAEKIEPLRRCLAGKQLWREEEPMAQLTSRDEPEVLCLDGARWFFEQRTSEGEERRSSFTCERTERVEACGHAFYKLIPFEVLDETGKLRGLY
ncbi:MAG: hypothetical protein AAFU77_08110 [Myxococcota bacterium]